MDKIILGIDPGKNFTGAVFLKNSEVVSTRLMVKWSSDISKNLSNQVAELEDWFTHTFGVLSVGEVLAIVEAPRIYPNSPVRANDQMDLSLMAGAFAAVTGSYKCVTTKLVTPREWKGTVKKEVHNERILKKMPSLLPFLEGYPKTKQEHIIDAAGLALYGLMGKRV